MRNAQMLEIHYTPKHGSWLNMAEIELGEPTRQCLDRGDSLSGNTETGTLGLEEPTQPGPNTGGLAFHHRGRTDKTEVSLPTNTTVTTW